MRLILVLPMLLLIAASPLTITKSAQTVSDPTGGLQPKAIPGAYVDYTVAIANPAGNLTTTVKTIQFKDAIPAQAALQVADLGLFRSGPIVFTDNLLPASGLTYIFNGLARTDDSLSFSSDGGATFTYVPVPDADGFDPNVTNIRVLLGGNQTAGTRVSLRFRVRIK